MHHLTSFLFASNSFISDKLLIHAKVSNQKYICEKRQIYNKLIMLVDYFCSLSNIMSGQIKASTYLQIENWKGSKIRVHQSNQT
jgi:hypothetical protein